jgi:RNA polymerase sigma factor (TIGR02999 family)
LTITQLTANLPASLDQLVEGLYEELRRIAHLHRSRERRDFTLQTTALVHEAYIRMVGAEADQSLQDRQHLRALTSRIIRHVLVDYARRGRAAKRDAPEISANLIPDVLVEPMLDVKVLDLDAALHRLAQYSPRMEKVVECRFFGGMNVTETAEVLNMSIRSVERDWQRARIYLMRFLEAPNRPIAEPPIKD